MKNKDYHEIPWVKERVDRVKKMLVSKDEKEQKDAKIMFIKEGRELLLRVTVTDPYLFRLVTFSIFDEFDEEEILSIPGATLTVVDFDLDKFEPRKKIKQWLQEQLKSFEDVEENQ